MANLKETAKWGESIYQLETPAPAMGGENGVDNRQARELGNRTAWLKAQLNKQNETKADKTTQITASDGLTGGGNLGKDIGLSLTRSETLLGESKNSAGSLQTGHSRALVLASEQIAGVMKLVDNVNSDATDGRRNHTANQNIEQLIMRCCTDWNAGVF